MRAAVLLLCPLCFCGDPLSSSRLEAVHTQRVEWMKTRVAAPLPGVYQDFRAVFAPQHEAGETAIRNARQAGAQILLLSPGAAAGMRDGVLIMPGTEPHLSTPGDPEPMKPADRRRLMREFKQYPDEVFAIAGENHLGEHQDVEFRNSSRHILARDLSESAIRASLEAGRYYSAQDWLCDPAGFFFIAENMLGAFDIGDTVPMLNPTRLRVNLPIPAHIRIERSGAAVAESAGRQLGYIAKLAGDYRVIVSLTIAGEERPWIESQPIHIGKLQLDVPQGSISETVEVERGIAYIDDGADKHKLDLYLPKGKKNFPVMVFLHGGSWREGDRSMYGLFGDRFARAGIGVAIPSYRLMPKDPYPAQVEDAAAAFAWVYRNIAQFGGDVSRLYLAGHSAGGHLAALLALDGDFLSKRGVPEDAIRGVACISGVYDVGMLPAFQNADDDPSPIDHVHAHAPPFLVTYCQWDYFGLPKEARDFTAALQKKFVPARLVFIPGQSHLSEILSTLHKDDATARALIEFIR